MGTTAWVLQVGSGLAEMPVLVVGSPCLPSRHHQIHCGQVLQILPHHLGIKTRVEVPKKQAITLGELDCSPGDLCPMEGSEVQGGSLWVVLCRPAGVRTAQYVAAPPALPEQSLIVCVAQGCVSLTPL